VVGLGARSPEADLHTFAVEAGRLATPGFLVQLGHMSADPRATSDGVPTPVFPRLVQLAMRTRHQEAALEWYVRSVLSERGRSSDPPAASSTQDAAEPPASRLDSPVTPPGT